MIDTVHRLQLFGNGTTTAVSAPQGKQRARFLADTSIYVRSGDEDAELPAAGSYRADGLAAFPFAAGAVHEISIEGGERLTFVSASPGLLILSFE